MTTADRTPSQSLIGPLPAGVREVIAGWSLVAFGGVVTLGGTTVTVVSMLSGGGHGH